MSISDLSFMFTSTIPHTTPLAKPNKVYTTNGKDNFRLFSDTILVNTVTTDDELEFQEFKIEPVGQQRTKVV
jgi:hypothetical protein